MSFWLWSDLPSSALHTVSFFSEKWSPALQIRTVLLSIQALLSAPNPEDPLANDVAEQWKINEVQAIETGWFLCGKRVILNRAVRHLIGILYNQSRNWTLGESLETMVN